MADPLPRQLPALERARPQDTTSVGDDNRAFRGVTDSWEVRFRADTGWRHVTAVAWWRDDAGRDVVQFDWMIDGEHWTGAFLADPASMRPYEDEPPSWSPWPPGG